MVILSQSIPTAKKPHKCDYCEELINLGEIYMNSFIIGDYPYTWKNHLSCHQLCNTLNLFKDAGDEGVSNEYFWDSVIDKHKELFNLDISESSNFAEILNNVKKYYNLI